MQKKISETGISQREILRRKLHKYCLDNNIYERSKKPLGEFILKILAITSKASTIESDITKNIGLKNAQSVHIINCSTSQDIARAISDYSTTREYDLIVLHRGGREDEHMSIFSSYEIIDAITKSTIPVVSALGHEQDKPFITQITDIDYSTPSAFAKEIKNHNTVLIKIQRELVQKITLDLKQITKNIMSYNSSSTEKIESCAKEIRGKYLLVVRNSGSNIQLYTQGIIKNQSSYIRMKQNSINSIIDKIALHAQKEIDKKLETVEKHAKSIRIDKKHFDEVVALNRKNRQIMMIAAVIIIIVVLIFAFF